MAVNKEAYMQIKKELESKQITLVAVSKTKPVEDITTLYDLGQRNFGENYVQELVAKAEKLPENINWHFIGHLQSNKVKYIAPFVYLIHGVDSLKLLKEINKEALKNNRVINVLLQVHIAQEETKFGFDEKELNEVVNQLQSLALNNINICGLMGMASFTNNLELVQGEFRYLKDLFDKYRKSGLLLDFEVLSMGMSGDYRIAIAEGSNMVRIGSLIFGSRNE